MLKKYFIQTFFVFEMAWVKIATESCDQYMKLPQFTNFCFTSQVFGPKTRHRYEPPSRLVPPPGVEDYDLENWDDPNVCSEYAMDIFSYYKAK